MPWLLKLMFQVPMSSPQITRMFGFLSAARAGAHAPMMANTAARRANAQRARLPFTCSSPWLGVMGDSPNGERRQSADGGRREPACGSRRSLEPDAGRNRVQIVVVPQHPLHLRERLQHD